MARCYVCGSYDCNMFDLPGKISRLMCESCRIDFDSWLLASDEFYDVMETYEHSLDNLDIVIAKAKDCEASVEAVSIVRGAFCKIQKELQILVTEMVEEAKRLFEARVVPVVKGTALVDCDCNACREERKE